MAVLSRPSLRSSVRRNAAPESPATEDVQVPSHLRRCKRTRDSSLGNESNDSSKKLKPSDSQVKTRRIARVNSLTLKTLPIRDRQPVTTDRVTQVVRTRKPDPVLVQSAPNGFTQDSLHPNARLHKGINQNLPPIADQLDKRSLRSHDGASRSKSELAPYFSNYDELISIEPKELDILSPDTILHISDEPTKPASLSKLTLAPSGPPKRGRPAFKNIKTVPVAPPTIEWPEETFTTLNNATRVDLSAVTHRGRKSTKDPLDDSVYIKVHAKEERKEKQLRNIEKERAMHEKVQLERLLDGLKGHDWLRVMGISGITDGEKKAYEPKRDHLIGEVRMLLEKFRLWKEEEKRRKVEKEETMEDDEDEEDEEEDEENDELAADGYDEIEGAAQNRPRKRDRDEFSDGDPPDYSDVDASAARQLHMEAILATKARAAQAPPKHRAPKPTPDQSPITSFYEKPYMRAAAIGKHRRSGRSRMAFGQPIPDLEERPFELPGDVKTTEAVLESGRRMRRGRRGVREL